MCGFRQIVLIDARQGQEFRRLAIAQRDRAGLVEQQRVHIARRLHRAAGHGEHIEAHQPVHAGNANGGEQRADGGGNERDKQRDQHQHRQGAARVSREARDRRHGEDKDDRHARQQDVERDFVGRLLPLRAFHQRDHAVKKGVAFGGGDLHHDPVGQHARAARDRRTVAA